MTSKGRGRWSWRLRRPLARVRGAAAAARSDGTGAASPVSAQAQSSAPLGAPTHQVGRFLLWVISGGSPSLRVAHADDPSRIIWDGAVLGGFLQAMAGATRVGGKKNHDSGSH